MGKPVKLFDFNNPAEKEFLESEALYQRGVATVRDLIAPAAVRLNSNYIQIGNTFARTHFVIAYPRFLNTNWFAPIINMDFSMDTALFIHPIETREVIKNLQKSVTRVQSQISIEQEAGKVRNPILETALQDIEEMRDKLQQGTEKLFRFGIYMTIYAESLADLSKMKGRRCLLPCRHLNFEA